jgi:hypothetical protein
MPYGTRTLIGSTRKANGGSHFGYGGPRNATEWVRRNRTPGRHGNFTHVADRGYSGGISSSLSSLGSMRLGPRTGLGNPQTPF